MRFESTEDASLALEKVEIGDFRVFGSEQQHDAGHFYPLGREEENDEMMNEVIDWMSWTKMRGKG
jgi:hypothetical protein